ncbi:AMP-binding protein [Amycolatopsis roodepoortensis]|uniref:phenylacetate--CoA ligase family protein n=1 Tax=Amycolatopsis roodepoortensis TaxID=700274 RepID=UPI00214A929D|nr:AMP-binding protein [Amycolatopsis roodepoortensis]UUV29033.1 AMP-binding protein [Amycolatopsis roodepoortensis]
MSTPETTFWQPATETMSRDRLAAWQWVKLRKALAHARTNSKFWATRIPDGLESLADFQERVPLLYKKDLVAAEAVDPPFGILPSTDPVAGVRFHQTSGTSGHTPLRTFDTARDWAWGVDMWCAALHAAGVRPGQKGCVAFGYGLFMGFWGMQDALSRMGCTIVPTGSMDSVTRVRLIVDQGIEVLGSTPTYAMRLLETAAELGIDLATDSKLRIIVTGAEPRSAATTRTLTEGFGARVFDFAGMTELGTVFMFECPSRPGACHIIEPGVVEEVLDPGTGRPAGYGERGVRVMTGLGREGIQVFRYWTDDVVVKRPWHDCPCGRTWDFYDGGILGRSDDMRKIRGISVTPVLVEDVVRGFDAVAEFQTVLRTDGGLDKMVLRIEPRPGADQAALAAGVRDAVKRLIGLQPEVRLAAPGELPRFEAKAARFHDERDR